MSTSTPTPGGPDGLDDTPPSEAVLAEVRQVFADEGEGKVADMILAAQIEGDADKHAAYQKALAIVRAEAEAATAAPALSEPESIANIIEVLREMHGGGSSLDEVEEQVRELITDDEELSLYLSALEQLRAEETIGAETAGTHEALAAAVESPVASALHYLRDAETAEQAEDRLNFICRDENPRHVLPSDAEKDQLTEAFRKLRDEEAYWAPERAGYHALKRYLNPGPAARWITEVEASDASDDYKKQIKAEFRRKFGRDYVPPAARSSVPPPAPRGAESPAAALRREARTVLGACATETEAGYAINFRIWDNPLHERIYGEVLEQLRRAGHWSEVIQGQKARNMLRNCGWYGEAAAAVRDRHYEIPMHGRIYHAVLDKMATEGYWLPERRARRELDVHNTRERAEMYILRRRLEIPEDTDYLAALQERFNQLYARPRRPRREAPFNEAAARTEAEEALGACATRAEADALVAAVPVDSPRAAVYAAARDRGEAAGHWAEETFTRNAVNALNLVASDADALVMVTRVETKARTPREQRSAATLRREYTRLHAEDHWTAEKRAGREIDACTDRTAAFVLVAHYEAAPPTVEGLAYITALRMAIARKWPEVLSADEQRKTRETARARLLQCWSPVAAAAWVSAGAGLRGDPKAALKLEIIRDELAALTTENAWNPQARAEIVINADGATPEKVRKLYAELKPGLELPRGVTPKWYANYLRALAGKFQETWPFDAPPILPDAVLRSLEHPEEYARESHPDAHKAHEPEPPAAPVESRTGNLAEDPTPARPPLRRTADQIALDFVHPRTAPAAVTIGSSAVATWVASRIGFGTLNLVAPVRESLLLNSNAIWTTYLPFAGPLVLGGGMTAYWALRSRGNSGKANAQYLQQLEALRTLDGEPDARVAISKGAEKAMSDSLEKADTALLTSKDDLELVKALHEDDYCKPERVPFHRTAEDYAKFAHVRLVQLCRQSADARAAASTPAEKKALSARDTTLAKFDVSSKYAPEIVSRQKRFECLAKASVVYGRLLCQFHNRKKDRVTEGTLVGLGINSTFVGGFGVTALGALAAVGGLRLWRYVQRGNSDMLQLSKDGKLLARDGNLVADPETRAAAGRGILFQRELIKMYPSADKLRKGEDRWLDDVREFVAEARAIKEKDWKEPEDMAEDLGPYVHSRMTSVKKNDKEFLTHKDVAGEVLGIKRAFAVAINESFGVKEKKVTFGDSIKKAAAEGSKKAAIAVAKGGGKLLTPSAVLATVGYAAFGITNPALLALFAAPGFVAGVRWLRGKKKPVASHAPAEKPKAAKKDDHGHGDDHGKKDDHGHGDDHGKKKDDHGHAH
jgi:hypothetical protein